MPADIEYTDDGRFRAVVAGAPGSHNSDLSMMALPEGEWPIVQNVRRGVSLISQRQALPFGAGGYNATGGNSANDLFAYQGRSRSGATYSVYYGVDNAAGGTLYAQFNESANATTIDTDADFDSTRRGLAQCGDDLILAMGEVGSTMCFAGTVHAAYTATGDFTDGSTSVTNLSSSLSAGQQLQFVGSYLVNTDDSASTEATYRVVAATATTVTLDRGFKGSAVGATKNLKIAPWAKYRVNDLHDTGDTATTYLNAVASMWRRVAYVVPVPQGNFIGDENGRRLRWSGIIDATDEGTAPFTGQWGFHSNGYVDLPGSVGYVQQLVPQGDVLVALCSTGICIIRGAPVFNGAGSLDVSTVYPAQLGVRTYSTGWGVSTPYGVYYVDDNEGLCVWDDRGAPRPVSTKRVTTLIQAGEYEASYYRDNIILVDDGVMLVYNIPSNSWTRVPQGLSFSRPQIGRVARNENLVAVSSVGKVVKLNYPFDDDSTILNVDGTSTAYNMKVVTPYLGDPAVSLRPERLWVTYLLSDGNPVQNPWLKVTVTTGLPGDSDADSDSHPGGNSWATTQDMLLNTSEGYSITGKYVTQRVEIDGIEPAPMIQLTIETQNKAYLCEVVRVVVEGTVEGEVS